MNGKPDCTGAVGDLTPGPTPAQLPGDPSWMFAFPLVYSYVKAQLKTSFSCFKMVPKNLDLI